MTKNTTVALVIIGLIVVGGIAYALSAGDSVMAKKDGDAMMDSKDAMPEAGAMDSQKDAMMKDDDAQKDVMTGESAAKPDTMMKDDASMHEGSYVPYEPAKLAAASAGDVVLFFRAGWCPTCRALDTDIRAHLDAIPAGLTILDVNYDDSTALKKKYGVTYQHTFVQVTADGTQIKKWSGSPTLAALVHEVQ